MARRCNAEELVDSVVARVSERGNVQQLMSAVRRVYSARVSDEVRQSGVRAKSAEAEWRSAERG